MARNADSTACRQMCRSTFVAMLPPASVLSSRLPSAAYVPHFFAYPRVLFAFHLLLVLGPVRRIDLLRGVGEPGRGRAEFGDRVAGSRFDREVGAEPVR